MSKDPIPNPEQVENLTVGHVFFQLIDRSNLQQMLDEESHGDLYATPETKDALVRSHVRFNHDRNGNLMLEANIFGLPTSISESDAKGWRRRITTIMHRSVETLQPIHQPPHDLDGKYVPIGDGYYVRITLNSRVASCDANLTLMYDGGDDESEDSFDSYSILKGFMSVWAVVNDAYFQVFDPQKHRSDEYVEILAIHAPSDDEVVYDNIEPKPTLGFDHIGGMFKAKKQVQDIADIFLHPDDATRYGIKPSPFLLYGPPGTGKNLLIETLAWVVDAELITVECSDVVEKWVGGSGGNLTKVFKGLPENKPIVLFFNEFDALGSRASTSTSAERVDVVKLLNTYIETIGRDHPNVIFAAATNVELTSLESSLIRPGRMVPIAVLEPTKEELMDVWAAVLGRATYTNIDMDSLTATGHMYGDDLNPVTLAEESEGFTGAHCEEALQLSRQASYMRFRVSGEHSPVTQRDLLDAIQKLKRR